MKYNAILRPSIKKCLFCSTEDHLSWKELFFHVPESTSCDKYAVVNSAGPDENNHKEQVGQSQHCLPS